MLRVFIVVVVVVAVVAVAVVAVVVLQAFNARCMDTNTAILTELCVLRNEKALILGYPDHASFVLDVRMAKTPKAVVPFLSDLSEKLVPLRDAERAVMLELKKAEKEAAGQPFDGEINGWDFRYYDRMYVRVWCWMCFSVALHLIH